MFGFIQTAYAQTTATVTDVATKTQEVASNNWEYGLVAALIIGIGYVGYRVFYRTN